jgi:hypothetical protein
MTVHAIAGGEDKSLQAGMNDHVTKPIDPDQLFATLQKWIKPVAERASVQKSPVRSAPIVAGETGCEAPRLGNPTKSFYCFLPLNRVSRPLRLFLREV